jgi:hypothetical protein
MANDERKRLTDLLKQLDQLDFGKLTLEELKEVKNPALAQALRDFLQSKVASSRHNSHFVHISHYSTMARPDDFTTEGRG